MPVGTASIGVHSPKDCADSTARHSSSAQPAAAFVIKPIEPHAFATSRGANKLFPTREIDYISAQHWSPRRVRRGPCKLESVSLEGIIVKKLPSATLMTLAALACGLPAAHAEEGQLYGLLRSRDLSPFGFLRLDMRPAHAISIKPGSWAVETEVSYQNTWALSPEVEDYLTALEPSGRRDLNESDVQAIRDLPGENYLLDLELALLDVT